MPASNKVDHLLWLLMLRLFDELPAALWTLKPFSSTPACPTTEKRFWMTSFSSRSQAKPFASATWKTWGSQPMMHELCKCARSQRCKTIKLDACCLVGCTR